MSSYEKSVKGATKIKLAPPKSKYIEHLIQATHTGEAGIAEVFRTLQFRLRDSTWTIAFKALIVVHLMIREGQPEAALQYLALDYRKVMASSAYADVQTQVRNIRCYSTYLIERARSYGKTKHDYVGGSSGRLKRLSVDKGLLRETESVQEIIHSLVKCDFFAEEPENEITLTAFRLLILDLLTLFQVMNEGTISILEHYFEMSKPDAERSLSIYKQFSRLTERVVKFLSMARTYEAATRIEIPRIKHAPTSLTASLEEYLNDTDFENNRKQYLASQDAKRSGKAAPATQKSNASSTKPSFPDTTPIQNPALAQSGAKGPSPDLIDFFESIEQNQQPMAQSATQFQQQTFQPQLTHLPQQQQQAGLVGLQQQPTMQQMFIQHPTNPFSQFPQQSVAQIPQQMQTQSTGVGFGGYTVEAQAQTGFARADDFQSNGNQGKPQQSQQVSVQPTNPFRQSMMPQPTGHGQNTFQSPPSQIPQIAQPTGTNPFAHPSQSQPIQIGVEQPQQQNLSPFAQPQVPQQPQSLQQQRTGTNPFARSSPASTISPPNALTPQATGSTNPFRHSAFVNQQTGVGWQSQQGTMGGLENLETKPIFPRPGQPQQQSQGWI